MKKKIIGLMLLVVVMAAIGAVYFLKGNAPEIISVDGYVGGEKLVSMLHGNVTDVGTVKSVQLFVDYKQNSLVIRLYAAPPKWSYLTIDDGKQKYVLQTMRKPLKLFTLIVGESNG